MTLPFVPQIFAAVKFVFTSQSFAASAIRFVGATLLSVAFGGSKQPRLSDLKIQVSSYGVPLPRLYGSSVRVAGNVIDKSDLIPVKHKKGGIAGFGGVKYYTYDAHAVIAIAANQMTAGGLKRIFADGKVIFDRDKQGATAGSATAQGGVKWTRGNKTHSLFHDVTFYPGSPTQDVDPFVESTLRPGEDVPAYRHTCYVVFKTIFCSDFFNRIPNLEFEIEPLLTDLSDIVEDIASFADVIVNANALRGTTVRGYIAAQDGSVWSAIEPLAGTYSFDLIAYAVGFRAVPRGRYMRTIIGEGDLAAAPVGGQITRTKNVESDDTLSYPDEVTVTCLDVERDYQTNSQTVRRNQGVAKNKINVEIPIVLTADEARQLAHKTLYQSIAAATEISVSVSKRHDWLQAGDIIGLPVGDVVEPFRLSTVTESPNGSIELRGVLEDVSAYTSILVGAIGDFPGQEVVLVGDTIFQPIDASIVDDEHDDAGFYVAFAGSEGGWRGAVLSRALGVGSPLTYTYVADYEYQGDGPTIADCTTTLGDGPTDVWDRVSTLTIDVLGGAPPTSSSEENVLLLGVNRAWIGGADGQDGEYIHYATVTPTGSPTQYVLSNLLRGRNGTEFATGAHGASERCVLFVADAPDRADFGVGDWNLPRTYKATSILSDEDDTTPDEFTSTGESKRPLSPVHLSGSRDASNNLTIKCVRRTRLETPTLGAGPVPLGETSEAYEFDILDGASPAAVLRTLIVTSPTAVYTAAQQTADGLTPGDPVSLRVYQISDVRGRGRPLEGIV
jgi:hypothetical protein